MYLLCLEEKEPIPLRFHLQFVTPSLFAFILVCRGVYVAPPSQVKAELINPEQFYLELFLK